MDMNNILDLSDHTGSGATLADSAGPLHILSGSFRSLSLALLAFYPGNKSLEHIRTIDAYGPHQYLALNSVKDVVYTTSWAHPPVLSSWKLHREHYDGRVNDVQLLNTTQITATSSYINLPPPYDFIYSAGGPTGEVHALNLDGSFGAKIQEYLFVSEEDLESSDKTRVALRYGSHGVEFSSTGFAFIPVLGTSTIEMYTRDPTTGRLTHVSSNASPRGPHSHDGPRHVKVHPNGKILYCVTEHNNFIDVYEIDSSTRSLVHIQSFSILPPHLRSTSPSPSHHKSTDDDPHLRSKYRGGTLMLTPPSASHPAPVALFTTTRGATVSERGWVSVLRLAVDGRVVCCSEEGLVEQQGPDSGSFKIGLDDGVKEEQEEGVFRFETPTSSGKANALDIRLSPSDPSNHVNTRETYWILLTDDDKRADELGAVRVLEWEYHPRVWDSSSSGIRVVAEWPAGGGGRREGTDEGKREEEAAFTGASHAIWLDS